jgi:hypothetical protein
MLAGSTGVALIAALAVGISGTARSESAPWPDGRMAVLWPAFSLVPYAKASEAGTRPWNGAFHGCIESARVPFDYRCQYGDTSGKAGYVCLLAGNPERDLSSASVTAVVPPADPTYRHASPAQVCLASAAYAMSLG